MNVLMIGLGAEILVAQHGDARDRHLAYASAAGGLTMIVSASGRRDLRPRRLSEHLVVYPLSPWFKPAFVWRAYRLGARICRERPIDLIVTQDPFSTGLVGYALKRRFRIALLINNHSRFLDNPFWLAERPIRHRLFNLLGKTLIRRAEGLRVVNEAERLTYLSSGGDRQRIRVLPTPVSLARFLAVPAAADLDAARRRLALSGRRVLLWVGRRWEPAKDLPVLLRALRTVAGRYPDVVLILVGDLTTAPPLRHLMEELGLESHLRLPGVVRHEELPVYYHLCELYVHSSRYEGVAKVMIEAAAAGKAVVSTRIPGIDAVLEEGETGLLVPIGDAAGLAAGVIELLSDPGRAQRMGEIARQRVVARFEPDAMIEAIVQMWRDVSRAGTAE